MHERESHYSTVTFLLGVRLFVLVWVGVFSHWFVGLVLACLRLLCFVGIALYFFEFVLDRFGLYGTVLF